MHTVKQNNIWNMVRSDKITEHRLMLQKSTGEWLIKFLQWHHDSVARTGKI